MQKHDQDPTPDDGETPGGQSQEPVTERPNVGTTTPEDYPKEDRARGA